VLILGFGNIGKELAIRLRHFGVCVLATKRSWKHEKFEGSEVTKEICIASVSVLTWNHLQISYNNILMF
jgi:phosphoglycerate dehydrogenase-like enzyme